MARLGWPERNRAARSFRQLRRFHHVINSDKVFGTHTLPSWDFEDEAEQSLGRPCRLTDSRSKRTYELTSSIVPRGTSSHRSVELECPPIAFDPERLLCRRDFPGPVELGAVKPYAVHDHGQPARQRNDRLFHPAVPGDLHRPGLEP